MYSLETMENSLRTDSFLEGMKDAIPLLLTIAPYAVVLGAPASRTGLSAPELGILPRFDQPAVCTQLNLILLLSLLNSSMRPFIAA